MASFWTLRRFRAFLAMQRDFARPSLVDELATGHGHPDRPVEQTYLSLSLFGFRAQAEGKTGFAALNAMRKEHPLAVHLLYAYLAVLAVAVLVLAARLAG
ncbi:hypothetical protein ACWGCW_15460 [Streptomyces sp. NPDC054933]